MSVVFEDGSTSGTVKGHSCSYLHLVHSDLWPQPYFKMVVICGSLWAMDCSSLCNSIPAMLRIELSRTLFSHTITKVLQPSFKIHFSRPWSISATLSSCCFFIQVSRSTRQGVLLLPTYTHSPLGEVRCRHNSIQGLAEFQDVALTLSAWFTS